MFAPTVSLPEHKITADDVTPELKLVAEDYARLYCGSFSFMQDMQLAVVKWKKLSPKQAAGVLNCLKAELKLQAKQVEVEEPKELLPILPIGTYTVAFKEGARVTVKIKVMDEDELAGWDFFVKNEYSTGSLKIKVLTGPDNESSYTCIGVQKHDGTLKFWKKAASYERAIDAVNALLDPETAKTARPRSNDLGRSPKEQPMKPTMPKDVVHYCRKCGQGFKATYEEKLAGKMLYGGREGRGFRPGTTARTGG